MWLLLLVGCAPQRGTLEGRVTYDEVPVGDGHVMLFPTDGNYRNASSVRIVDGRYRIEGIIPGERRVSLENLGIRSASSPELTRVAAGPDTYPATIVVAPGKITLDFSLGRGGDGPAP